MIIIELLSNLQHQQQREANYFRNRSSTVTGSFILTILLMNCFINLHKGTGYTNSGRNITSDKKKEKKHQGSPTLSRIKAKLKGGV